MFALATVLSSVLLPTAHWGRHPLLGCFRPVVLLRSALEPTAVIAAAVLVRVRQCRLAVFSAPGVQNHVRANASVETAGGDALERNQQLLLFAAPVVRLKRALVPLQ